MSVAFTSISPVFILGFTLAPRETTFPRMPTHHSRRSVPASSWAVFSMSGSKTTWVRPSRSRRSMKTAPPWSRRLLTQPKRTTVWPMSALVSWPQEWVRLTSVMKFAGIGADDLRGGYAVRQRSGGWAPKLSLAGWVGRGDAEGARGPRRGGSDGVDPSGGGVPSGGGHRLAAGHLPVGDGRIRAGEGPDLPHRVRGLHPVRASGHHLQRG